MRYILKYLKAIPLWRLILAAVLLFGIAVQSHFVQSFWGVQPSFQEFIYENLENSRRLFFILLLLVADFGFKHKSHTTSDMQKDSFLSHLGFASLLCISFILLFVILSAVVLTLKGGYLNFVNEWHTVQFSGPEGISPTTAMILSLILFFLRFVFLTRVVFTINSRCRKIAFGYVGGLALFALDGAAGSILYAYPIGIFPVEHTYLEFVLRRTSNVPLNIFISAMYWIVLIVALSLIYTLLNRQNKHRAERKGMTI